jgi:hypothetical protein
MISVADIQIVEEMEIYETDSGEDNNEVEESKA